MHVSGWVRFFLSLILLLCPLFTYADSTAIPLPSVAPFKSGYVIGNGIITLGSDHDYHPFTISSGMCLPSYHPNLLLAVTTVGAPSSGDTCVARSIVLNSSFSFLCYLLGGVCPNDGTNYVANIQGYDDTSVNCSDKPITASYTTVCLP